MTNHHANIAEADYGRSPGSFKSYFIGFILSIILVTIPFLLVSKHLLTEQFLMIAIVAFAIMRLMVQLVFFIHLNSESKPRWNLVAFIFTLIILVILVWGYIWIMDNLNYNMTH